VEQYCRKNRRSAEQSAQKIGAHLTKSALNLGLIYNLMRRAASSTALQKPNQLLIGHKNHLSIH